MSNYELNAHKKSDTVKWVVAFTLIFALVVGMTASIYIGLDNRQEEETPAVTEVTAPALQANTVSEAGIRLMSARTTDVSPAATGTDDSVTITATLTASATGYDTSIQWSVNFKDPDSSWASGKDVNDYVTMTVASDTHSVQVSCDTAFGEPIIITAVSMDNTACTASCQLDYVKRVTKVTSFSLNSGTYENYARIGMENTVTAQVEYGVGTLTPTVEIESISMAFLSGMNSIITSNLNSGMLARDNLYALVSDSETTGTKLSGTFSIGISNFYNGGGDNRALNNALYNAAYDAATGEGNSNCKGYASIVISVSYGGTEYQSYSHYCTTAIPFERGEMSLITSVTALALDPERLIF